MFLYPQSQTPMGPRAGRGSVADLTAANSAGSGVDERNQASLFVRAFTSVRARVR